MIFSLALTQGTQGASAANAAIVTSSGGGTVYGVARFGGVLCAIEGSNGCGSIYQLTVGASWVKWGGVACKFKGKGDGAVPEAKHVLYNGMILGTTNAGGRRRGGTIFQLVP